jgi:high affinity sulfate transporter 1
MISKRFGIPMFEGILPIARADISVEVIAGVTLAALAIPEVMGYTQIAGMPVVTGLYTLVLPVFVFAVLGSSRHLVVGADSATAAVMAAGLAGIAASGSSHYVALASLLALLVGGLLLLARLVRLGFIADFLSRTVLVGFLTGVGIQVAVKQLPGMLGTKPSTGSAVQRLIGDLSHIGDASVTTVAVSASVILVIVGGKMIAPKVPGALIAVIGSIVASSALDLSAHGVATLGHLPGGLPNFGVPNVSWSDIPQLAGTAVSILVVVLAQSAATSRAYAAKYEEPFDENVDLIGLAGASIAAGFSNTFVVNGSPTKTQMVDSAGGRSQLAQLTTGVIVVLVLLFLTEPIKYMPKAVLASVVFIIGVELVDSRGMAKIYRLRLDEFVVACLTAVTVVFVGVEEGIILAIVSSIVDHLRRSYRPNNSVLMVEPGGNIHSGPVAFDARTMPGLVVYRFTASIYFANANLLLSDVTDFIASAEKSRNELAWFCIDAAAIADVDYTGAQVIDEARRTLDEHHVRLVFTQVLDPVSREFDRYGLTAKLGKDAFFATVPDVVAAFARRSPN